MLVTEQTFGFRQGQPNAGFVQALWLLRVPDVLAVGPPTYPVAGQPMTVSKAGLLVSPRAVVTRLAPPTRTATFEETMVIDQSGKVYQQAINLALPRPSAELTDFLFWQAASRWVAFWTDGNGQGWVAGEPGNGLWLATAHSQAEANTLRIALTGRSIHPAWRLESTCLTELFPDAAFDYSFTLSFDS